MAAAAATAAAAGQRRALSGERVLFLLALASTLLLASALVLRGEGGGQPRAFRDGFTVAEGVARRVEGDAAAPAGTSSDSNNLQVALGEGGARTTTIKTQDGDEITIKHAGGKQTTTISRDEGGKITIENVAHGAEEGGEADEGAAVEEQEAAPQAQAEDAQGDDALVLRGGRKVTVIQVGRDLTKVELSAVDEQEGEQEGDEQTADELDDVTVR